jgi:4-aminobutyrate aminotransferase/(S)-3-amino-2-methylpropionate transaminase
MMAVEIVRPGTLEPDPDTTRRVVQACHRAGVVVLSCGSYSNVIRLLPPLVIDEALLVEGLDVLAAAFDEVLAEPA